LHRTGIVFILDKLWIKFCPCKVRQMRLGFRFINFILRVFTLSSILQFSLSPSFRNFTLRFSDFQYFSHQERGHRRYKEGKLGHSNLTILHYTFFFLFDLGFSLIFVCRRFCIGWMVVVCLSITCQITKVSIFFINCLF
jgi:hypothetical protein